MSEARVDYKANPFQKATKERGAMSEKPCIACGKLLSWPHSRESCYEQLLNVRIPEIEAELVAVYEQKDEQISAMVELMKEARDCLVRELPECECHQFKNGVSYDCIQCRLKAAIKKATE